MVRLEKATGTSNGGAARRQPVSEFLPRSPSSKPLTLDFAL